MLMGKPSKSKSPHPPASASTPQTPQDRSTSYHSIGQESPSVAEISQQDQNNNPKGSFLESLTRGRTSPSTSTCTEAHPWQPRMQYNPLSEEDPSLPMSEQEKASLFLLMALTSAASTFAAHALATSKVRMRRARQSWVVPKPEERACDPSIRSWYSVLAHGIRRIRSWSVSLLYINLS